MAEILFIVIPCYNEEAVLPSTSEIFLKTLMDLIQQGKIDEKSRILFVDDGSSDKTWNVISDLAQKNEHFLGMSLSTNRGHQNALLAGLMEAKEFADITVSADCDGQDDIDAIEKMIDKRLEGFEIVFGVRNSRKSDGFFKRSTAQTFYKLMNALTDGGIIYNHADYRLVSSRVLKEFANFHEVNLFLRGMFPLVGFKSTCVYYERKERIAGISHYPLSKMISLAVTGITSLSIKPLRFVMFLGFGVSLASFFGVIWTLFCYFVKKTAEGWASMFCVSCFIGGIQLVCLGILGEYIGKTYLETKARPRYIVDKRTWNDTDGVKKNRIQLKKRSDLK